MIEIHRALVLTGIGLTVLLAITFTVATALSYNKGHTMSEIRKTSKYRLLLGAVLVALVLTSAYAIFGQE